MTLAGNRTRCNSEGSKKPTLCYIHAEGGIVDVFTMRCSHEPCTTKATFIFKVITSPVFCCPSVSWFVFPGGSEGSEGICCGRRNGPVGRCCEARDGEKRRRVVGVAKRQRWLR